LLAARDTGRCRAMIGTAREPNASRCRGEIKPQGPIARDGWMTDAPEITTGPPAYMAQKSVTSFTQQGAAKASIDPGWMAAHLLSGPGAAATVQPLTNQDVIAQKNEELLRVAAAEAAEAAAKARCRAACMSLLVSSDCWRSALEHVHT
jgi:hypothetical protein